MSNTPKIWYSYKGKKYDGDAPPFYDLNGIDWYDSLKKELPQVRAKLLTFLKHDEITARKYFNTTMVEGTRWEAVSFMFWKLKNKKSIKHGADIFKHFSSIPGIVSLSASILQPQTRIKGHYGDTDAIYRIHIPVLIPAQLPDCGLTVGDITKPWVENDMIVFCDAHFHEAWNMTDEPRIVMILDVIKQEYLPQTNKVCANVLSSIKYQYFSGKLLFIKKFPGWLKDIVRNILKLYPIKNTE